MVVARREGGHADEAARPARGALEGVVACGERGIVCGVRGYEGAEGGLGAEEGAAEVEFRDGFVSGGVGVSGFGGVGRCLFGVVWGGLVLVPGGWILLGILYVLESEAEEGVGAGNAIEDHFVAEEESGVEGVGDFEVAVLIGVSVSWGCWGVRRSARLAVEKLAKTPMSVSFVASVRDGSRENGAACTGTIVLKHRSSGMIQSISKKCHVAWMR